MPARQPHAHRGFAMLLVLISLAVATIMATAYLASRDNSNMIGANASEGSTAKWAALAGLKSGIAVLETNTDWRTNHTAGVVFTNAAISGASVDLSFTDLVTGNPPTADTTDVKVVAIARVGNMSETVTAHAHVPMADKDPELDLGEFAVFGKDKLAIKDSSLVTRWSKSPRSRLGKRIAMGTANTTAAAVSLADYAVALDSVVYKVKGASDLVLSNSGPGSLSTSELPDTIIVPSPPSSGVLQPLALVSALWSNLSRNSGATFTITNNRDIKALSVSSNAVITMRGPVTVTVADTMTLASGGKLQIEGNVKLVVFGKVQMGPDTSIDLADGATLTMYAADDFDLNSASINQVGMGTERKVDGTAEYFDPNRFVLYEYDNTSKNWSLDHSSTLKGRIYAPSKNIKIHHSSAVYGNVVGKEVELASGGSVYYDHMLDRGNGYTVTDGILYGDDGLLRPIVKSVNTLDTTVVNLVDAVIDLLTPAPGAVGAGDPTPRTVDVTYQIVGLANDVSKWEEKASMIVTADDRDASEGGDFGTSK